MRASFLVVVVVVVAATRVSAYVAVPGVGLANRKALRPLKAVEERPATRAPQKKTTSSSIGSMSSQLRDIRSQLEADEETSVMMEALRGRNLNDDDRQGEGIRMRVVEVREDASAFTDGPSTLPLRYDPDALASYFAQRPGAVAARLFQIASTSFGFLFNVIGDAVTQRAERDPDTEVKRAAELRRTIVSLGPFFIKLGQALSIRPDILSPRAMRELQQLCDKVPSFDSTLAFETICKELEIKSVYDVFSDITPEPVAAASLGQVYKANLKKNPDVTVAVKVQRPFVLETVSLDLYLARQLGLFTRFLNLAERLDLVALLDEFASRFFDELDYVVECENGLRVAKDMAKIPGVKIPQNYPEFCTRRVHVAEWVNGEKLSQSSADDVLDLVNLGVVAYLTQLLETGFFHADPHPGNMIRGENGELVILDFGLMTEITDDQRFGMVEAIAHLIHRDYDKIGDDFVNLNFIPEGTDVRPIVPALSRVFDAALSGGGAKAINFNELSADLATITFEYPFRIPPYFALIIRAIGVLEGIALVGNEDFAIVDESYPFIARQLLTDPSPRMQNALRYMIYGKSKRFDVERLVDMLQALERFAKVKEVASGTTTSLVAETSSSSSSSQGGGGALVPRSSSSSSESSSSSSGPPVRLGGGDRSQGRRPDARFGGTFGRGGSPLVLGGGSTPLLTTTSLSSAEAGSAREALRFLFGDDGALFRDFLLDEVCASLDAAARLAYRPSGLSRVDDFLRKLAPPLDDADRTSLQNARVLYQFLVDSRVDPDLAAGRAANALNSNQLRAVLPLLLEHRAQLRLFAVQVAARLAEKQIGRALNALVDLVAPRVGGGSSTTFPAPGLDSSTYTGGFPPQGGGPASPFSSSSSSR